MRRSKRQSRASSQNASGLEPRPDDTVDHGPELSCVAESSIYLRLFRDPVLPRITPGGTPSVLIEPSWRWSYSSP